MTAGAKASLSTPLAPLPDKGHRPRTDSDPGRSSSPPHRAGGLNGPVPCGWICGKAGLCGDRTDDTMWKTLWIGCGKRTMQIAARKEAYPGSHGPDLSTRKGPNRAILVRLSTRFSTGLKTRFNSEVAFLSGLPLMQSLFDPGMAWGVRSIGEGGWCRGPDSNWGHRPFQGRALPAELPRLCGGDDRI